MRRLSAEVQLSGVAPHEGDELLVDDLDDHLGGGEAFKHILPDGALRDALYEVLDDLIADVGFEQGEAHLAHRLLDVRLAEAALAAELPERGG